ncbi:MAG: chemotaxis protein CheD [Sandaracinobacter sp.]|jgi:chemotaxis protein CheD
MQRIPIIQGEHAVVSRPGVMITTLLGSCIAVCLQDPTTHIGGMNHFLLGEPGKDDRIAAADLVRYGVHSMELLINELMRNGARRDSLKAQMYGGASVVAGLGDVGKRNIDFARRFLTAEGIPLGHSDVGGKSARRVEFLPYDGRARSSVVTDPVPVVAPAPRRLPQSELELF